MSVIMVTHELESLLSVGAVHPPRPGLKSIIADGNPRELYERSEDPRVKAFLHRRAPSTRGEQRP